MEHAPLRPLPSRSSRPADPELARRYVGARLPGLDEAAVRALALVELAHVERGQAGLELGLGDDGMGAALARARKELRRSRHPLAGSGWCERAERLISDRLDGDLGSPARNRLDAHLRNCPRCVEHELRLTQELDALAEGMPAPAKPAAALRLVLPPLRALPPGSAPNELEPAPEEPAIAPAPDSAPLPPPDPAPTTPPAPAPRRASGPPPAVVAAQPPSAEPPATPPPPAAPRQQPPAFTAPPRRPPAGAAPPAATSQPSAAVAPRPLADPRPGLALIAAFSWHIALVLAVVLAVAAIAVAAIGIGGGAF